MIRLCDDQHTPQGLCRRGWRAFRERLRAQTATEKPSCHYLPSSQPYLRTQGTFIMASLFSRQRHARKFWVSVRIGLTTDFWRGKGIVYDAPAEHALQRPWANHSPPLHGGTSSDSDLPTFSHGPSTAAPLGTKPRWVKVAKTAYKDFPVFAHGKLNTTTRERSQAVVGP